MSRTKIILFFSILGACSKAPNTVNSRTTDPAIIEMNQIKSLNNLIDSELTQKDARGNIESLEGFSPSRLSKNEADREIGSDDFKTLLDDNSPVFTFEGPDNVDSAFSPPQMVLSASLLLINNSPVACESLEFQESAPNLKDLVEAAKGQSLCGNLKMRFCIRMSYKNSNGSVNTSYAYTQSPLISFTLPCENEVFGETKLSAIESIEGGPVNAMGVFANQYVKEILFSKSPNCDVGVWQEYIPGEQIDFSFEKETMTVYSMQRDIFGRESECQAHEIEAQSTVSIADQAVGIVPSDLAISIGASELTSSLGQDLSLHATNASEMYITNTTNCLAGGAWEAYSTSKLAWNLGQSNAMSKVFVKFRDPLHNESDCISDSIVHDSLAPSTPSISIAGGVSTKETNSDLTLAVIDASPLEMYISNIAGCSAGGVWEPYTTSKSAWILGQNNSTATVYVKFRDALGHESSCVSDTIIHDNQAPSAASLTIAEGDHTNASDLTLTLAATGASEMYITNTAGCATGGTWESYATSKAAWIHGQINAVAPVYVVFRDEAGNQSNCVSDSIIHDNIVPSAVSVTIDGGVQTSSSTPNLSLAATGASEMYVTNTISCSAGGTWEAYATSKAAWALAQSNTTATVYAKFRDEAGNVSACVSDVINHDSTGPSSISLSIDGGTHTSAASPNLSLAATGAAEMYITNTAGCSANGTWESYGVAKSAWALAQSNSTATVYAKFRDASNNESACISDTIVHDSEVPTAASLSIDEGTHTNLANLTLTLSATGAAEMYITNTSGCASGGSWETYATSKASWSHGQTNSSAPVYAIFRDEAGNESSCVTDTIIHDNLIPSSVAIDIDGGTTTSSSAPNLTLAATGANEMYITNTAGCSAGGSWEIYTTTKVSWSLAQNNTTATVYAKFRDEAGNESACLSDDIIHDGEGPSLLSLSIDGDTHTNLASPNLTLGATGATEMYITNTAACGTGGSWESYSTSKASWTLGQSNTTATVYVKYRDALNNESSCISDTIVHDNQIPSSPSLSIDEGSHTNATNLTLTLAATGASEMYITNTSGCASGGTWESYATSKGSWAHGQTNASASVYAVFRDEAGNESSCVTDSIIHDNQEPSAVSVSIDGGAQTSSSTPDLALAATGASEMYITNTAACSAGGAWENYATSKSSWTLGQSNATATVYTKYRDEAGNESTCVSDSITHDNQAPSSISISIDGGTHTNLASPNLTLAATGASEMYITNTAGCSADSSWESFASSKSNWTLGQVNTTATVYVKFRDASGNESACLNDTIIHDDQGPSATSITIDGGAISNDGSPNLSLGATDASEMYITNTPACSAGGSWESYATSKASWSIAQNNTTATVYVKFRDSLENESACINDTIIHDDQEPSSTSILIVGGASTNDSTPDLSLAATSASEMYISNTAGCAAGGSWETYATSKPAWPLGQSNATATVYVKFRDAVGNESTCINDTIIHDNQAPSATSITIDGGASTNDSTPDLSLAATDASEMYLTNTSGCTSGGSWESYASSKTSWTLSQLNALATVYAKYRDTTGNESSCESDTITHDNQAPTGTSIMIGSGGYTSLSSQTIYLGATEASQMYITNTSGCASGGSWVSYSATQAGWSLGQTNATATVYVAFRDDLENTSACINDTIVHDNVDPTDPSSLDDGVTTNSESSSPSITWLASSDATSGISGYEMSIGTSAGATDTKGWTFVGDVTSASFSDLTLSWGGSYFANIRSIDNATNESSVVSGDSFLYGYLQQAYIKSVNGDADDHFGRSVAISGDTLVVGAHKEGSSQSTITNGSTASSNNSALESGAVYVYRRTGSSWAQEAYIKASNSNFEDEFGHSIAISGDTLVVGADHENSSQTSITNGPTASSNNSAPRSGAIYVYKRTGSSWTQEAYIKAANADSYDYFGLQIAISDETIVVGVQSEDSNQTTITNGPTASSNNLAPGSGAAYVYRRTGTSWEQEAYIKASNANSDDEFGVAVAISGDTIVVGASDEDSSQTTITNGPTASSNNSVSKSGAVYVYKRTGTNWAQQAYIKAVNPNIDDQFGDSVSISGDTLVVGAEDESSNQTTITNGSTASSNNSLSESGAVYVYTRTGSSWAQEAYIKASNAGAGDKFGYNVIVEDDTLLVAAFKEGSSQNTITNAGTASSDNSALLSGAAYLFRRTGSTWTQKAYIKASNSNSDDQFGYAIGMSGDSIVVGATNESSNQRTITNGPTSSADNSASDSGAVYVIDK